MVCLFATGTALWTGGSKFSLDPLRTERMRHKGAIRIKEEVSTNKRVVILSEFLKNNNTT